MVDITIYSPENGGEDVAIKGRLLGFLRPNEFADLLTSANVKNKVFTSRTVSVSELVQVDDVAGLRLVSTIKERDGEPVLGKKLFITEPLDMISSFGGNKREAQINGKAMYYILSEEE